MIDISIPQLTLPKAIKIANPRLNRFFYFIALVLVGVRLYVISSDPEIYTVSIAAQIQPSVFGDWPRAVNTSLRQSATHPQLCPDGLPTVAENYQFEDLPFQYLYTGYCKLMCGANVTFQQGWTDSCVNYLEAMPTSDNLQVFQFRIGFLTMAPWLKGSNSSSRLEEVWLPEAADFRLYISYNFQLLEKLPYLAESFELLGESYFPWPTWSTHYIKEGSSSPNHGQMPNTRFPLTMKTVILDQRGKEFKNFEAGESISLTLAEALSIAKHPLKAKRGVVVKSPKYYLNFSEDPFGMEGTLPQWVYHFGARIETDIGCYMSRGDLINEGGLNRESSLTATPSSPLCLVRFRVASGFVFETETLYAYEIHVRADPSIASNRFFSMSKAVSMVIDTFIFMMLSRMIMRMFVFKCLGDLSHVYRNAAEQPFDERMQIASLVLRLAASSWAFQEFVDVRDDNNNVNLMSLQSIYNQLRVVCSRRAELVQEDIERVARFCCKEVATAHSNLEIVLGQEESSNVESKTISIDDYNRVCSQNDATDLHHVISILDNKKRRRFLERLFTPKALKAARLSETEASLSDHAYETYGRDLQQRSLAWQLEEVKQAHVAGGLLEEMLIEVRSLRAEQQHAHAETTALKAEIQTEREFRCSLEARIERLAIEATEGETNACNQMQNFPCMLNGFNKEMLSQQRLETDALQVGLVQHKAVSKPPDGMHQLPHIAKVLPHPCLQDFESRLKSFEQRLDAVEACLSHQVDELASEMAQKFMNAKPVRASQAHSETLGKNTSHLRGRQASSIQLAAPRSDGNLRQMESPHDVRRERAHGADVCQTQVMGGLLPLGTLLPTRVGRQHMSASLPTRVNV